MTVEDGLAIVGAVTVLALSCGIGIAAINWILYNDLLDKVKQWRIFRKHRIKRSS